MTCYVLNIRKVISVGFIFWFFLQDGINLSLLAPLFPNESYKKDVSKTMVGFIIGIFDLVIIVYSFIIPKYLGYFNLKTYLCFGVLLQSSCTLLIGVTDLLDKWFFIGACLALRSVAAVGTTYLWCTGPPILFSLYPNHKGRMASLIQVATSVGFSLGPALGSLLFYIGGFSLPFVSMGLLGLGLLLEGVCIMSSYEKDGSPEEKKRLIVADGNAETETSNKNKEKVENSEPVESLNYHCDKVVKPRKDSETSSEANPESFTRFSLLTDVRLCVVSVPYILCNILFGLTAVYLAPYMDLTFDLSEHGAGTLFTVMAISSAATAPLVGFLCDHHYTWHLFNFGPFVGIIGLGMMLMFLCVESTQYIGLLVLSFFFVGATFNIILISGFIVLVEIIEHNYPEHSAILQQTMVSAWSHMTSIFGKFLGRALLGGLIFDYWGYDIVLILQTIFLFLASIIGMASLYSFNRCKTRRTGGGKS